MYTLVALVAEINTFRNTLTKPLLTIFHPGLTQGVKLKLLFWYIENGRSVISTQQKFRLHYKKKKAPDRNTILDIVKNMKENGSVGIKVQKKRSNTSRNQNP